MRHVLGGYLRGRVAGQIFGLLLALTGLMQVLELLEVTTEVLDRKLGVLGLMRYAALRVPSEMLVALPLAGLLGSMAAFHALARNREITALRAAGVGLRQLLVYLLPVPFLFALLQIALSQYLAPRAEASRKSWWDSTIPIEEQPAKARWVRTSNGVLLFERNSADGARLLDLRIYSRDSLGLLELRTMAHRGDWNGEAWVLSGVRDLPLEAGVAPVSRDTWIWQSNLRPAEVIQLDAADPHLSGAALADVIGGDRVSTKPRSFYETLLLQSFTAPFAVFIMMLLAMPAAIVSERGGGGGRMLLALALGLAFLLADGIFSSFGTSGRVPPLVSAVTAPLLFAVLGFLQLRGCERS